MKNKKRQKTKKNNMYVTRGERELLEYARDNDGYFPGQPIFCIGRKDCYADDYRIR